MAAILDFSRANSAAVFPAESTPRHVVKDQEEEVDEVDDEVEEKELSEPSDVDTESECEEDDDNEATIIINISGRVYEVYRRTLLNLPNTRLAQLSQGSPQFRKMKGDYYFDRDTIVFEHILNFYRTGELHLPVGVCVPYIKRELDYWGIQDWDVDSCCSLNYTSYIGQRESLAKFDDYNAQASCEAPKHFKSKVQIFRARVWSTIEYPSFSRGALVYSIISSFMVLTSIMLLVLSSHPTFHSSLRIGDWAKFYDVTEDEIREDMEEAKDNSTSPPKYPMNLDFHIEHPVLDVFNQICVGFFTIEFFIRLLVCSNKCRFFLSPINMIDVLSIIPYYVQTIIFNFDPSERYHRKYIGLVQMFMVIRVFRVFRLLRQVPGLRILLFTLQVSIAEISMTCVFIMIGVLIFGCVIHYVDEKETFKDIPLSFWWAIVTMTTVGYGDMVPNTPLGYVVGTICSISGVMVIALTIPIIVNNFQLFYSYIMARERLRVPKNLRRPYDAQKLENDVFEFSPLPLKPGVEILADEQSIAVVSDDEGCVRLTTKL